MEYVYMDKNDDIIKGTQVMEIDIFKTRIFSAFPLPLNR